MSKRPVEVFFVFAKVSPVLLVYPGCVSGNSHADMASGQCLFAFLMPAIDNAGKVKSTSFEIPLSVWIYLYAPLRQVAIKVRNRLLQRTPGVFLRQRLRGHPQAELLVFQ